MERNVKESLVAEFSEKLGRAKLAIVTDYRGTDVNTLVEFRKKLARENIGAEYRVVKNTLLRRAITGTAFEALGDHLTGTNAVLLSYEDIVLAAKKMKEFAKENEKVSVKGGAMEGKGLASSQVEALADLPSKEVLQAMLLGVLQAPSRNLVSLLANANRQILNVLDAYRRKLEGA